MCAGSNVSGVTSGSTRRKQRPTAQQGNQFRCRRARCRWNQRWRPYDDSRNQCRLPSGRCHRCDQSRSAQKLSANRFFETPPVHWPAILQCNVKQFCRSLFRPGGKIVFVAVKPPPKSGCAWRRCRQKQVRVFPVLEISLREQRKAFVCRDSCVARPAKHGFPNLRQALFEPRRSLSSPRNRFSRI